MIILCPEVSWEEKQHIYFCDFIKKAGHFLIQNFFFFSSVKEVGSYWFLPNLTELNRRTWFRLEICSPDTHLLNCLEKKQLNRKTGKFTGFVFLSPLPGPFLLQLWLIILRAAGAVGALSRVQWGSSKNASGHLLYCASYFHSLQLLKSCVPEQLVMFLSLCLGHFLKVNIPSWLEHATIMLNSS